MIRVKKGLLYRRLKVIFNFNTRRNLETVDTSNVEYKKNRVRQHE
jgi:hypothetical protein